MPTLEIGGKRVEVGPEFLQLSPEDQQTSVNDIARQIGVAPPEEQQAAKPITEGEKQFEDDKKLLAQYAGYAPDALKAFSYSALNTALLNTPEHVAAAWDSISKGKDYSKSLEEQRAYQKALERQHSTASGIGTAAGIGLTLAVPGGAIARLPQAAKLATAAKYGPTLGRAAEIATAGGVGAGMSGTASILGTTKDLTPSALAEAETSFETLKDAAIGFGGGAALQTVLPILASKFSRAKKLVDESGKPTQKVLDTIDEAFGKGRYTPEEINDFAEHLLPELARKGITPEAVRAAKLKESGVEPTRSMTTGEKPLPSAQEVSEMGRLRAEETLGAKAKELIGTPPEGTELAEKIREGALAATEKGGKKYEKVKKLPGEFTPEAEAQLLGESGKFSQNIQQSLRDKGVPLNLDATQGYTQSEKAMNYLNNNLLNMEGKYPFEGGLNARNIDAVTQDLNNFWFKARGDRQDQRAISAIKDGYLRTIKENIIDPNMFTGDGEAVLKAMKKAKKTWAEMQQTYYPTSGAGGAKFNAVMNELVDHATGRIGQNVTAGSLEAAQGAINSGLLNKKAGLDFYERLERALGKGSEEMNGVNAQIRSLALDTGGDLSKLSAKINSLFSDNPTIAAKAFPDPKQRYQLKSLADNLDAIYRTNKPNEQKQNAALKVASKAGSFLLGVVTSQAKGPIAGMAAYNAAEGAKGVGRGILGARQKIIEAGGAPKYKPTPSWSQNRPIPNYAKPFESNEEEASYGAPKPLPLTIHRAPIARATGGRVAAKLVSDVERAKKAVNDDTKLFLHADDSHVARALEIANQNTEG